MKKQFILLLARVVSFPILATANKKPTPAKRLIQRLSCIQSHGIMFGHQDDTFIMRPAGPTCWRQSATILP